jgi:transposase
MKILTIIDAKWKLLEKFFPEEKLGRPRKWKNREILEAVLYLFHSGCQWRSLPPQFPPYQTVYPRFRQWEQSGILVAVRDVFIEATFQHPKNLSCLYGDATFVRAMRGGDQIGSTKIGKGSKIMTLVD